MTNTQLLMAALAYSQCGNWQEVAESIGTLSTDGLRCAVVRASENNPAIASALEDGRELGEELRVQKVTAANKSVRKQYHVRNELAFKRDREIHSRRASQPSPVTLGQKLLGEPVSGRSALDKVETDGRGNITKKPPGIVTSKKFLTDNRRYNRVSLAPINIPSVSINNNQFQ